MTTPSERAFEIARDITKQVITLATAVVTLEVTVFQVAGFPDSTRKKMVMCISWGSLALSIIFGLLFMMAAAGQTAKEKKDPPDIYGRQLKILSSIQLVLFIIGLIAGGVLAMML